MPFKIGKIEFRWDTLLFTVLIVFTMGLCTSKVIDRLAMNGTTNSRSLAAVADGVRENNNAEKAVIAKVEIIEEKQKQLQDVEADNISKLIAIRNELNVRPTRLSMKRNDQPAGRDAPTPRP